MASAHETPVQPSRGHEAGGPAIHVADQGREAVVVPVVREELGVEKQTVQTHRVRVHKTVHERAQRIKEPLYAEELDVERVRIDQVVDSPPAVRREGDVLIVPLLEEVLVKKLVLREEIRIRRRRRELPEPQPQTLRYEQAHIERIAQPDGSADAERDAFAATAQDDSKKET